MSTASTGIPFTGGSVIFFNPSEAVKEVLIDAFRKATDDEGFKKFTDHLVRKFKYEPAPFVFALLLGPMIENALRQSLLMSEGSFGIFFTRPISCVLIMVGIILFTIPALPWFKRKKFVEPA